MYQNNVNSSLISTRNCKMGYSFLRCRQIDLDGVVTMGPLQLVIHVVQNWINCRIPCHFKAAPKDRWIWGYSVTTYQHIHKVNIFSVRKNSNPSRTLWTLFYSLTYTVSQFTRQAREKNRTVLIYQKPHVKN